MQKLRVSPNGRFLIYEDGSPFYWFGDTAWELFHRSTRENAELYLNRRKSQRFSLIQAVVLAEENGIRAPNAYGHLPVIDEDPTQPNEEYFRRVDWIIQKANSLGPLAFCLLGATRSDIRMGSVRGSSLTLTLGIMEKFDFSGQKAAKIRT